MSKQTERSIEVNGRMYRLPSTPTVVVCIDGCDTTIWKLPWRRVLHRSSAGC